MVDTTLKIIFLICIGRENSKSNASEDNVWEHWDWGSLCNSMFSSLILSLTYVSALHSQNDNSKSLKIALSVSQYLQLPAVLLYYATLLRVSKIP